MSFVTVQAGLNAELTPCSEVMWITSLQKAWHLGFTACACGNEKIAFDASLSLLFLLKKKEREKEEKKKKIKKKKKKMRVWPSHRDFPGRGNASLVPAWIWHTQKQMQAFTGQVWILMLWKMWRNYNTSFLSGQCNCLWKKTAIQRVWVSSWNVFLLF